MPGSSTVCDGALEVLIHPLIVLSVADHYTRARVRSIGAIDRVFGVLLGLQRGRKVEICYSFEVPVLGNGLDLEYLQERAIAEKQVFLNYDVMGWYSTYSPGETEEGDMEIQKSLEIFGKSLLYMSLNPNTAFNSQEIPIYLYETEIKIVNDHPVPKFSKITYKIETNDIERIAIDYAVNSSESTSSQVKDHLINIQSSIKMLRTRIQIVSKYLKCVVDGVVQVDHAILRQIYSLVYTLPALESAQLEKNFVKECNLTLLLAHLSTTVKATSALNDLVDKFNLVSDDPRMSSSSRKPM